jgi:putative flippase GtrA
MKFVIYVVVGLVAWLVDLVVFYALWPLVGIAAGQLAARIAGAVTAFLLNRSKTFQAGGDAFGIASQATKYVLLLALNWVVTVGLINFSVQAANLNPLTSKILVDMIIVPSNYFVMKHMIFGPFVKRN